MHNYILKNENAVFYECGFSCDNEIFLKIDGEAFFITDSRYLHEAALALKNVNILEGEPNLLRAAVKLLLKKKVKKITLDPKEWSIEDYKILSKSGAYFQKNLDFSKIKRAIKSQEEIQKLKTAAKLGAEAFEAFGKYLQDLHQTLGADDFKIKKIDEKYLQFRSKNILQKFGEYELSFEPILAINQNGAKPHSFADDTILKRGDLILFDGGLKFQRYCSDRTRTVFFDENINFIKKQNFTSKEIQKVYDTVLFAQEAALKIIKPGILAKEIDAAARKVIEKAGFGKYFIHSTGHGVGLDIHEFPNISSKSNTKIEEKMVFTVEPGIYIAGFAGVRIEDTVVVNSTEAEIL